MKPSILQVIIRLLVAGKFQAHQSKTLCPLFMDRVEVSQDYKTTNHQVSCSF